MKMLAKGLFPVPNSSSRMTSKTMIDDSYILRLLKSKNTYAGSVSSFQYAFTDVAEKSILHLIEELLTYPMETGDSFVANLIYLWYSALPIENFIGFSMTNDEYQRHKANNIVNIITSKIDTISLRNGTLLDVGAGDCIVTCLVSEQLKMTACAVDVESEIDWGGVISRDIKPMNVYKKYMYDGHDLLGILKNKKFRMAMYNHSLHHFPSAKAQFESIRQIAQILEPRGVLFISEHVNDFNNDILDLVHILLNLRYSIDRRTINSGEDASNVVNRFKKEQWRAQYLSKSLIYCMAEQSGFQLCAEKHHAEKDITQTAYYCFIKQ